MASRNSEQLVEAIADFTEGNGHSDSKFEVNSTKNVVPATIIKRDGREVPFDIERIENAITRCFKGISNNGYL